MDKQPDKARELEAAWQKWNAELVPPLWGGGGQGKAKKNGE